MGVGDFATWVGVVFSVVMSTIATVVAIRSANAADRSAVAAEEANELTRQAHQREQERTMLKPVDWVIDPLGHNYFALRNKGNETAVGVRLHEGSAFVITSGPANQPFDVLPNASTPIRIATSPVMSGGWELLVSWDGQPEPIAVPLPSNPPPPASTSNRWHQR